jgi:uncharacterized protein (TIGR02246 family)
VEFCCEHGPAVCIHVQGSTAVASNKVQVHQPQVDLLVEGRVPAPATGGFDGACYCSRFLAFLAVMGYAELILSQGRKQQTKSLSPSEIVLGVSKLEHEREPDMATTDEAAIPQLMRELEDAWNRGDAQAYGARYQEDGTFTNVNGSFYVGREAFTRRHEEGFRGIYQGTTLALTTRELRFIRPDVAVVDIDVSLSGLQAPPGVQAGPDGTLHTCLLMVLVKEHGSWWIAAYHNVWRKAAAVSSDGEGRDAPSRRPGGPERGT